MKRKIYAGTTSFSMTVIAYDNTSTNGVGLSGITHTSSGLVFEYRRAGQSTWTSVTPVSKTLGIYTSGGIVANGAREGRYEIDPPDAAIAPGVPFVEICLRGVANMHPVDIEIELDAVNYQDSTRFGLGAIPNVVQGNSGALPTGDASGRVTVIANQDKTGYSLTQTFPANFAALGIGGTGSILLVNTVDELGVSALSANGAADAVGPVVWEQLTTTTWPNNSFGKQVLIGNSTQRTVAVTGSHHVAADIHELQPGVIVAADFDSTALVAIADSVLGRNTSTSTYDAGDVGYVLRQVYSMIVADGVDWQYSENALELAPSSGGGGGGGTDWTANERTAIRGILGFNSSGSVIDPTVGILDEIRDDVGSIGINVYPVSASTPERVSGTTLTFYRNESRSVSVVTDFTLTSMVLEFVVEDAEGNDILDIANGSISRSGQTFTVSITTAVTGTVSNYRWSLRDITSGNSVIARGILSVQDAPSNG